MPTGSFSKGSMNIMPGSCGQESSSVRVFLGNMPVPYHTFLQNMLSAVTFLEGSSQSSLSLPALYSSSLGSPFKLIYTFPQPNLNYVLFEKQMGPRRNNRERESGARRSWEESAWAFFKEAGQWQPKAGACPGASMPSFSREIHQPASSDSC